MVSSVGYSYEKGIDTTRNGDIKSSDGIYRDGETEDDELLGNNRGIEGKRSNEMDRTYEQLEYDFEKNGTRGDSLHIGVEESTPFFIKILQHSHLLKGDLTHQFF